MRFPGGRITRSILGIVALAFVLVSLAPSAQASTRLFSDHDTLDLTGDWILSYGYTPGFVNDGANHYSPNNMIAGLSPWGVHFDAVGPNSHGGTTYKGYFINTCPVPCTNIAGRFSPTRSTTPAGSSSCRCWLCMDQIRT